MVAILRILYQATTQQQCDYEAQEIAVGIRVCQYGAARTRTGARRPGRRGKLPNLTQNKDEDNNCRNKSQSSRVDLEATVPN